MAHGYNPAKVPNSNIRHDGILSIGNFMLIINNHFTLFQLPGNLLKTKKCAPYFRGNMEFPIYFYYHYKPFYVFDRFKLRDVPMLFILRQSVISPVPSDRSSQIWTRCKGLGPYGTVACARLKKSPKNSNIVHKGGAAF
jgi:hypothetical protein